MALEKMEVDEPTKEDVETLARRQVMKRFQIATVLCLIFMVVEVVGGLIAGSLAVLSDAAHLSSDLASFAVAIAANYLASLPSSSQHTYGLRRTESLAALFSMVSLVLICAGLSVEAVRRLWAILVEGSHEAVDGKLMTGIATIGVCVNVALAFVLGEDHGHLPGGGGCEHDHSHGDHKHRGDHDHGDHKHDNHSHEEHNHGDHCSHDEHNHDEHNHDEHNHDEHKHDEHKHDEHKHDEHKHDEHKHDEHKHDTHSHDEHNHDTHSHDNHCSNDKHPHDDLSLENGKGHGHGHSHNHHGAASEESPLLDHHRSDFAVLHSDEMPPCAEDEIKQKQKQQQQRNVNLEAAYLHVLGDLAQSVAVLIAGLIIWWKPEYAIVDPLITLAFCILVFYSTLGVLKASVAVLLEEVPPKISWHAVNDDILALPNITDIHDLHIWSISHGIPCLSAHCTAVSDDKCSQALRDVNAVCRSHGISHITIQMQPASESDCLTCDDTLSHPCK